MHNQKYVFSQLLDFLDRNAFNYLARRYDGDKYVKQFTCYNQLAVLMFGQLSNRESLRDVVLATQAHAKKAFHLGFGKHASRSTLADANTKRDYRIFEEFAYKVVAEARACRADDIFKLGGGCCTTSLSLTLKGTTQIRQDILTKFLAFRIFLFSCSRQESGIFLTANCMFSPNWPCLISSPISK